MSDFIGRWWWDKRGAKDFTEDAGLDWEQEEVQRPGLNEASAAGVCFREDLMCDDWEGGVVDEFHVVDLWSHNQGGQSSYTSS